MRDQPDITARPFRVYLAEPNPLVTAALRAFFEAEPRFTLAAHSDRGADLLAACDAAYDLAVLACELSDMKGAEVLRRLRSRGGNLKVCVFSNDRDAALVRQAIRLGAQGYCYQFDDPSVLFETLFAVANGRMSFPYIDVTTINDTPLSSLTVRERELLGVLSRGWTNQQIANRTGISENTVKYHLKNLYEKLGVKNRAMAVAVWSSELSE